MISKQLTSYPKIIKTEQEQVWGYLASLRVGLLKKILKITKSQPKKKKVEISKI